MGQPEIDTTNDHLIGSRAGTHVVMLAPPVVPMPYEEALRMAAWIVMIADPSEDHARFTEILNAIKST